MQTQAVRLIDRSRSVVATMQVTDEGTHYSGTIDLHETPTDLLALFREFDELVNGQVFSLVDEVDERIERSESRLSRYSRI